MGTLASWTNWAYNTVAYGKNLAYWFADYVQAGSAGGPNLYEYLIIHPSSPPGDHQVAFASEDYDGYDPRLTITYLPAEE